MRLIDADELLKKAWDIDCRIGYVQVVDVGDIEEAPTVDVVPMNHWKWASDGDGWVCPECGKDCCTMTARVEEYKYCPACGERLYPPIGEPPDED